MCICLVQMEAAALIAPSFLWLLYRSCLQYCKYQPERSLGGRNGITNRVCLCYFCAENCSWLACIGYPGPPPVSSGSTKAIKERWLELCFALYHLRASGLTLLEITLACSLSPWEGECCNRLGGNHAPQSFKCWRASGSFSMGPILSHAYFNTKFQPWSSWGRSSLSSAVFCVLVGNMVHVGWEEQPHFISHISLWSYFGDSKSIVV